MAKSSTNSIVVVKPLPSLRSISVEGFKSINEELTIDLGKLTVLAGVNSSGKSSIIQPLLLLKQTLEAPFDPGPLRLNGPNVKFTKVEQLLCANRRKEELGRFAFGMTVENIGNCKLYFTSNNGSPVTIHRMNLIHNGKFYEYTEYEGAVMPANLNSSIIKDFESVFSKTPSKVQVSVTRDRCFLYPAIRFQDWSQQTNPIPFGGRTEPFKFLLMHLIHIPGLRGNPERTYPVSAVGIHFPGTFENYTASIIALENSNKTDFLARLSQNLRHLGLASQVDARLIDDTQVELRVGRLPNSSERDMVNIADVGFGVSQTLPVVVALLSAKPNQIVYIEQPEIHLHPRAQHAMAKLLVDAANRGVQVIIETHSSILLLGIQSLVAENAIDPEIVKLHWFRRDKTGDTQITSAELDAAGRFGDWPEDFDDVSLQAQRRYLDAAEKQLENER